MDHDFLTLFAKGIVGTRVTIAHGYMELIAKAYEMGFTNVDFDPEAPCVTATGHPDAPELSYDFYGHTVWPDPEVDPTDIQDLEIEELPTYIAAHSTH